MSYDVQCFFDNRIKLISLKQHNDIRGNFYEFYNKRLYSNLISSEDFVQDNISFSKHINTIRGLHFQTPPHNQAKVIHVLKGSIFDVVIDLNPKSKFFGTYKSFELNENDSKFLYVSNDFAHGFCTLKDKTHVIYKTSKYYNPKSEKIITWKDKFLSVKWPNINKKIMISKKDSEGLLFDEVKPMLKLFIK